MSDEDPVRTQAITTVQALSAIEEAAGGRLALSGILEAAPGEEFELLSGLLADPANDGTSLATLCRKAGLSVRDFLNSLRDARYARMSVEIGLKVAEKLPAVAEDIVSRSVPHYVQCDVCEGRGELLAPGSKPSGNDAAENIGEAGQQPPAAPPCPACRGRKQLLVMPELARQKLALELGGVLSKGPGVQVGVVVNNPNSGPTGTTPAFRAKTDKLLWDASSGGRTVDVEATVVEGSGAEVPDDAA